MADFTATRYRHADKDHTCAECRLPIRAGSQYAHVSGATDGHGWTVRLCERCDSLTEVAIDLARSLGVYEDEYPSLGGAVEWILDSGERPAMLPEIEGHFWGIVARRREATMDRRRRDGHPGTI